MHFTISSKAPIPYERSVSGCKAAELKVFKAFMTAYREFHGCKLELGAFDAESRIQIFRAPTYTVAHTAESCKRQIRAMKFRGR